MYFQAVMSIVLFNTLLLSLFKNMNSEENCVIFKDNF